MPRRFHLNERSARGFTLVEMLVVVAIMVVLIGLLTPAISSITRGSQLTQSANLATDQLNLARQLALTKNMAVEVRFYRYGDPSIEGESASNQSSGHFRALQLFGIKDTGQAIALGKVQRLLGPVIFDRGSTLSSLLYTTTTINPFLSKKSWTSQDPQVQIPGVVGTAYDCCAFRFLPDGTTSLPVSSSTAAAGGAATLPPNWFVTLHNVNDRDPNGGNEGLSSPPKNFSTIQIDPSNGHIRTFRP